MSLRRALLCATAAAAIATSGCGQLSPHGGLPVTAQVIQRTDLTKVPPGSPQSALMQWWQNVQYGNLAGYLSFLSPAVASAELKSGGLIRNLTLLSGALQAARPQILNADIRGTTATVYTQIYKRQLIGNSRFMTVSSPQAFSLTKQQGRWQLADDNFVRQQVRLEKP